MSAINGVDPYPLGGGGAGGSAGASGMGGNPGTMEAPVATIAQGIANALTIMARTGGSVDVFVAEGDYPEKVVMVQGVNLLGGFSCDAPPCTWARDPGNYVAQILNQDSEGVLADSTLSRATRIDGFTITGITSAAVASTMGATGITVLSGSPTITNNVITGGDVTGGDWTTGRSTGIQIVAPTNDVQGVLIDSNTINGGTSGSQTAAAIAMDYAPGLWRFGSTYAVVTRNTIQGGTGPRARPDSISQFAASTEQVPLSAKPEMCPAASFARTSLGPCTGSARRACGPP